MKKGMWMHPFGILLQKPELRRVQFIPRYGGKRRTFSAIVEAVAEEFVRMFRGIQEKVSSDGPGEAAGNYG